MAGRWNATEKELEKYKDEIPALKQILDQLKSPDEPQKSVKTCRKKISRVNRILINPFRISVGTKDTDNFVDELDNLIQKYAYNNEWNRGWQVEETVEV